MNCSICHNKTTGKRFTLSIDIKKDELTSYGYGRIKNHVQITGHYHCLEKLFSKTLLVKNMRKKCKDKNDFMW
jgi:hypothetical protein